MGTAKVGLYAKGGFKMIRHLQEIRGTETETAVIKELNRLTATGEFIPCRYSWSQIKAYSTYLIDMSSDLSRESGTYVSMFLERFNKVELDFLFRIKKALLTSDQHELEKIEAEHHTNVNRVKRVVNRHTTALARIKSKLKGNL